MTGSPILCASIGFPFKQFFVGVQAPAILEKLAGLVTLDGDRFFHESDS
jgi:hypothetical protein